MYFFVVTPTLGYCITKFWLMYADVSPLICNVCPPLLPARRTEIAAQQKPASKVRVTFYESSKPLVVTSPEPSDFDQYSPQDFLMASPLTDAHMPGFDRQLR